MFDFFNKKNKGNFADIDIYFNDDIMAKQSFFYSEAWQIIRRFLLSFFYALSLLPLWLAVFTLQIEWLPQSLIIALTLAALLLITRFSKALSTILIIVLSLGIFGAIIPAMPLSGWIGQPIRAVYDLFYNRISYGSGLDVDLVEPTALALNGFIVLLSLLVALLVLWRPHPLLAFIFSSVLLGFAEELSNITHSYSLQELRIAFAFSMLIVLYIWTSGHNKTRLRISEKDQPKLKSNANDQSRRARAIPVSILLLAIVLFLDLLLPNNAIYIKSLDDYMSKIIGERSSKSSSISYMEFSLGDLGFYPLENRLGGKPDLSDDIYMYLDSDARSIYLRGTAFLEYTGYSWIQDGMNPNWLMSHSRNLEAQKQILGQIHPYDFGKIHAILPSRSFELRPAQEQQVIFNGGRPKSYNYIDSRSSFNVYFNRSGNLYLDKRVPEHGYRADGQFFDVRALHNEDNLKAIQELFPMMEMSPQDKREWIQLPDGYNIKEYVQEYFPEIGAFLYSDRIDNIDKILRLRSYLADNFSYSLDVPNPSVDQDFVTHFLELGRGYCTYFASAYTVLLRSAGIPARYVEGFLIPEAETEGIARRSISFNQGHAWTEVWFDHLGWIPLDSTPASTLDNMVRGSGAGIEEIVEETDAKPVRPTASLPQTEQATIPGQEKTQVADLPNQDKPNLATGQVLYNIVKVLVYILIFSSPIWLYVLWRQWIFRKRHNSRYLKKIRQEESTKSLIAKVDKDLESLWSLEGYSRKVGETMREFVDRANEQRNLKIDPIYRKVTEINYYDNPERMEQISEKDIHDFLIFYENEEYRLRKELPRETWIFKRFLWSAYHPLPR